MMEKKRVEETAKQKDEELKKVAEDKAKVEEEYRATILIKNKFEDQIKAEIESKKKFEEEKADLAKQLNAYKESRSAESDGHLVELNLLKPKVAELEKNLETIKKQKQEFAMMN